MKKLIGVVLALVMSGCATINGQQPVPVDVFVNDLKAAQSNFEAAGLTTEAACLGNAVAALAGPTRNYQVKGVVSLGSVAYITAEQAQSVLSKGVSPECQQVVGKVVLAINAQTLKSVPFAVPGF